MKKLLQIAAVVLVALLAAQPALAGLLCTMGSPMSRPGAPSCGMVMSQMALDCPMASQSLGPVCESNCCKDCLPQVVAQLTAASKPQNERAEFVAVAPQTMAGARDLRAIQSSGLAESSPPPRYILLQVFRI